jgi:hypothetical protein
MIVIAILLQSFALSRNFSENRLALPGSRFKET